MSGANTPRLETERLILRRFTPEDVPAIHEILGDPKVNEFVPFRLSSPEDARRFYEEHYAEAYRKPQGCAYAICLKDTGRVIGYIGAATDEPYDLGYGLRPEFWRQGYVSEAARAVTAWLKEQGLPYVTATHDVENPRSGRVMRAIGMTYRYTYHEHWEARDRWVWFRMYQLDLNGESGTYMGYWDKYPEHRIEENLD